MKFTVEGFSQSVLIEMGLDHADALILQWFSDFQGTGKMKTMILQGEEFSWVKYQAVIDDLPCLCIKNRESVSRRFKNLCEVGVLEMVVHKVGGTFTMFKKGPEYYKLLQGGVDSKVDPAPLKSRGGVDSKVDPKDSSIRNSPTTYKDCVSENRGYKTMDDLVPRFMAAMGIEYPPKEAAN